MNKDAEPDYKPVTAMTIAEINKRNQELYKNASANSEGVQATRDSEEKVERFSTRVALNNKLDELKAKGIEPKVAKIPAGGFEVSWSEKAQQDTDFFEGPEGYVHPIRGTKGYSNRKAGK
jgi:hypothetical protein